jgi:hypothetical protein
MVDRPHGRRRLNFDVDHTPLGRLSADAAGEETEALPRPDEEARLGETLHVLADRAGRVTLGNV